MKVAVIGSRSFNDATLLSDTLAEYPISLLVSGGAKGADSLAEAYAKERNISTQIIKPDWSIGKHAGFVRNTAIIEASDVVIAFWDGKSKGTFDSLTKAKRLKKKAVVVLFDQTQTMVIDTQWVW